ncbi:hypothetical protein E1B28_001444 [Marasmius oreades]|uniref:Deoxycytidylate deaminase n=1 Tax=Marasmius oreades TaxID=181124 RepID=A0A9P7V3H7_9AGAR|nr:uncharacterized protein E1B28_001444 [Marasmius oreades]KAG7099616.1 hypothetical protein E1B28_001444 [Marasmius oreades]
MLIAIIGTRCSGKSTLKDYLVSHKGFIPVHTTAENHSVGTSRRLLKKDRPTDTATKHLSFLSMDMTPVPSPALFSFLRDGETLPSKHNNQSNRIDFFSPGDLLDHATKNWTTNFVTTNLDSRELVEIFLKRPFFMLLCVDAPLYDRFRRCRGPESLEEFVQEDDTIRFGSQSWTIAQMNDLVNVFIMNDFSTTSDLYNYLDELDLPNPSHLRPGWDTYFMTLASLASHRSNCMKRRVGAILVRDHRILSTGYNGTPRHLRNCNEGGCPHCNGVSTEGLDCLCLHAEENALLEVGRERVGDGCVLYCNTCPCLKCTIKIIQTGVQSVVYNLTYKMDDASARLFQEAGVELRRFDPNIKSRLPTLDGRLR